jgi:hypothetical protein
MKRLAKWGILVVVVILLVCLLKYFDAGLGFTANSGHKLTLKVPDVTHLSRYLDGSEYQISVQNMCATGLVMLLISMRILFLRMFWP